MLNPVMQEIVAIKKRLNDIERRQSQFTEMLSSTNRSDIDFIAMETGVDLDQNEEINDGIQ